ASIPRRLRLPELLHAAAQLLPLDALALLCARRLRRDAPLRRHQRRPDKRGEALARFVAVALLRAVAVGADDEHALVGHAPSRAPAQTVARGQRQARRMTHIEAQLDRRRYLVDVLSARPRGTDEPLLDFALVDRDLVGDAHGGRDQPWPSAATKMR